MVLSPEEAAKAIKSGRLRGPVQVSGRLDLTDFSGAELPAGLHCYELDATNSRLTKLPPDLRIESRLVLNNCLALAELPEGLSAGSISLRNCTSLWALPENLSTWFLDLTGCARFEFWPKRGTIHHGALLLRGCVGLRNLPRWLGRLSQLDLSGCVQLRRFPTALRSAVGWILEALGLPVCRRAWLAPRCAGAVCAWMSGSRFIQSS